MHLKDITAFLKHGIPDTGVVMQLDFYLSQLQREESHVSKNVINTYDCFKKTIYEPFTRLAKNTEMMPQRMSSHPLIPPSWTNKGPLEFVKPKDTISDATLFERCHDMRELTLQDQNAQIHYLSKVWGLHRTVQRLIEDGKGNSPKLKAMQQKLEQMMKKAQELHRQKFKKRAMSERMI